MTHPHDESTPNAQPQRPSDRPQPAYGELAPEGWEWKPETSDGAEAARSAGASPVTGVPHNLGARGTDEAAASATAQAPARSTTPTRDPEPYRAPAPQSGQQAPLAAQQPTAPAARKPRMADRVITIILLVMGVFGSLNFAGSMMSMPGSLSQVASALDLKDFSVPAWVATVGTVSAIAIFAIFAVSLIFSIQRMRAGKLAFWVPLTAGVIVVIGTIIVSIAILMNIPELMNAAADPGATEKLWDSLADMSQP
ncbi:DUF6264 family protein [Leucobacter sp. NPDC058333]|uniref:DUF6264 family protein n=1 Tax=Leucobacter sp. NPDC058333 TaxID=3346450 RepID=UPI003659C0C6